MNDCASPLFAIPFSQRSRCRRGRDGHGAHNGSQIEDLKVLSIRENDRRFPIGENKEIIRMRDEEFFPIGKMEFNRTEFFPV